MNRHFQSSRVHRVRTVPPVILAIVVVAGLAAMGESPGGFWAWGGRPAAMLSEVQGEAVALLTAGRIAEAARRLHGQPSRPAQVAECPAARFSYKPEIAVEHAAAPLRNPHPFCLLSPHLTNLPPPVT